MAAELMLCDWSNLGLKRSERTVNEHNKLRFTLHNILYNNVRNPLRKVNISSSSLSLLILSNVQVVWIMTMYVGKSGAPTTNMKWLIFTRAVNYIGAKIKSCSIQVGEIHVVPERQRSFPPFSARTQTWKPREICLSLGVMSAIIWYFGRCRAASIWQTADGKQRGTTFVLGRRRRLHVLLALLWCILARWFSFLPRKSNVALLKCTIASLILSSFCRSTRCTQLTVVFHVRCSSQ